MTENTYVTGVYKITNTVNGKVYVGSTASNSVEKRIAEHLRQLRSSRHHNRHLQSAWGKYGEQAFTANVIKRCSPETCIQVEQEYIDFYKSSNPDFGYNISPTAGNTRGVKYPPEVRRKVSEAIRLAYTRPDVKESRRAMLNREEYKLNHVQAMKRVMSDPSYKEKMSNSCKVAQQRPDVKARVMARLLLAVSKPEYREKQRVLSTGRKHSEETKQKMRDSNTEEVKYRKGSHNRGKKLSEETKEKMRKPKSEQTRKNMSEAAKQGWVKRKAKNRTSRV